MRRENCHDGTRKKKITTSESPGKVLTTKVVARGDGSRQLSPLFLTQLNPPGATAISHAMSKRPCQAKAIIANRFPGKEPKRQN